jgi:DNA-binding CsgD family transcriptional regulator
MTEMREAVLSPGEAAVIEQLRRGKNQVTIARETGRSVATVRTVCKNVREKFRARSVKELLRGIEEGAYVVTRRPVDDSPAFGLASALAALKRERDRAGTRDQMRTVRLHREEISAILRLANAAEPSPRG